jgi:hypothetical protein
MVRHQCDKNNRIHLFLGHNKFRKVHWTNSRQLFCFNWSVEARDYGFVQRDCATAHTRCNSMAVLQTVFWYRINCPHLWPVRSPDLTTFGEVWKKSLKGNTYQSNPRKQDELKQIIRSAVATICRQFQKVFNNPFTSCQAGHFQHLLQHAEVVLCILSAEV